MPCPGAAGPRRGVASFHAQLPLHLLEGDALRLRHGADHPDELADHAEGVEHEGVPAREPRDHRKGPGDGGRHDPVD